MDGVAAVTGAWTQGDVIVVSVRVGGVIVLHRVSGGGGATTPVAPADDATSDDATSSYPSFFPDGRFFVYLSRRNV